ncbi:MAG: 16S rRNA (cytosine(1402)-N(4))-methyltransferase RsmH [Ruminococcaceae bacterium]|nr:16S rRNA (cytosine(1402)-N(4))-methyltransferase RsmH [Oscillospiraceae bacterium]
MSTVFSHYSVLLNECIDGLDIKPNGTYVDLTTGGGGHSFEIAKRLTEGGKHICLDRDDDALEAAGRRLGCFSDRVTFVKDNFRNLGSVLDNLGIERVDGVIADLGVSSYQLDTAERGFSYNNDGHLDMRMNKSDALTAYEVVNTYSKERLKQIIFDYGEEKFAPRIASFIEEARLLKPIETTAELSEIIKAAIPQKARNDGPHPAKRTFQAIRIEVNGELDAIEPALTAASERLNVGGRLAVISFHSLEDRIVKKTFAGLVKGCTCPPDFPVCMCGKKPILKLVSRKPILPSARELEENPRSRSAKLRVAERV